MMRVYIVLIYCYNEWTNVWMSGDLNDLRVIMRGSMKIICLILFDYENIIIIAYYNSSLYWRNAKLLWAPCLVKLAQVEPWRPSLCGVRHWLAWLPPIITTVLSDIAAPSCPRQSWETISHPPSIYWVIRSSDTPTSNSSTSDIRSLKASNNLPMCFIPADKYDLADSQIFYQFYLRPGVWLWIMLDNVETQKTILISSYNVMTAHQCIWHWHSTRFTKLWIIF